MCITVSSERHWKHVKTAGNLASSENKMYVEILAYVSKVLFLTLFLTILYRLSILLTLISFEMKLKMK